MDSTAESVLSPSRCWRQTHEMRSPLCIGRCGDLRESVPPVPGMREIEWQCRTQVRPNQMRSAAPGAPRYLWWQLKPALAKTCLGVEPCEQLGSDLRCGPAAIYNPLGINSTTL